MLNRLATPNFENIDFPRGIHATKEVDKVLGQVISRTLELLRAADSGTQEV
jgi:hypothetical protein